MREILQKQREYFNTFETYDLKFRTQNLKDLKNKILERREDIIKAFKEDMNKGEFEVIATEIGLVLDELDYLIKNLKGLATDRTASSSRLNYPAKNFQIFEPYGLTLVVSPWNFPFQLTLIPVIGAIAGGNTVIVKPSRNTPNVTRVIKEILSIFPENYVYVVTENDKIDDLFDQNFDFIFYTGSGKVGRELLARQAKFITPMILELGGKCPCIVSRSANIKAAARRIAFGKFLNAGQTSVAPDFILIDRKVKDKFVTRLINYIKEFYYTDDVLNDNFVRIVNKKTLDEILEKINPTKVVFGGKVDGLTLEPTVLDGVTFDDEIMQEEIFGPVLPIIEYDDINEAIEYLRTKPKPLALYYFGRNQREGAEVLKKCPSGGACINEVVMHVAEHGLPFGGVGESGIGSYHGAKTFYSFVHAKSVLKRSTWFDFKQKYPPYDEKKLKFAKAVFGVKDPKPEKEVKVKPVKEKPSIIEEENEVKNFETEYDMIIVPDGEMTLENTVDMVEKTPAEPVEEVIVPAEELVVKEVEETEQPAEETVEETPAPVVLPEIENVDNDNDDAEQADDSIEEETIEATEETPTAEEKEIAPAEEIADITEQVSTIDREPEDFEEDDFEEEPEIVEELGDEEDEIVDEEELAIRKIDQELEQLEEDDNDDAEQADDFVEEPVEAEETVEEDGFEETTEATEEVEQPAEETVEETPTSVVLPEIEDVDDNDDAEQADDFVEEPVAEDEVAEEDGFEEPAEETEEVETVEEAEEVEETEEVEEERPTVPKSYSSSWGSEETEEEPEYEYKSEHTGYSSGEEEKPYRIVEPAVAEEEPVAEDEVVEEVEEAEEPEIEEVEVEEVVEKPKKTATKKTATKKATTKKATTKKTTTKKKTATTKKADSEEKPKKTATKKAAAKKTTTKKATTAKATKAVAEKKTAPKKETVKKEPKVKEPKEVKEPKKRAPSKKADAAADAKRAQDDINAMLNQIMPGSAPKKEEVNTDDDFLNSLNSLISQNIDKNDGE